MGLETFVPVQEIALTTEKEVPPEFVVGEEVQKTLRPRPEDEDTDDGLHFPEIDLQPLVESSADEEAAARVKREIGQACEDSGFFQVINHGIPEHLLEKVLEVVEGFFDLPLEEKMVYSLKPDTHEGYGLLTKPKIRAWSDAFRHVVRPLPPPDKDAQPRTPAEYKEVMAEYASGVVKLAKTIASALSDYLGLESSALETALSNETHDFPGVAFALNLYPKCPQPDRVLGIYPHADFGAMTVLYQNQVEGLQVLKGDKWLTVKPVKNSLVVNVSNQLKRVTNGRLKSSKHRAIANSTARRVSIAAFCNPGSFDVIVRTLPQFIDEEHPNVYEPMPYGKYLSMMFSSGFEKSAD
ncbi:unnamed protein product [Calypogeia fissa]